MSWDRINACFLQLNNTYFLQLLKDLTRPKADRTVQFDVNAARTASSLNLRSSALPEEGEDYTFLLLGAAWVNTDYFYQITKIKRRLSAKFVCVIHDLIPIYARETCDQGTAEVFRVFLEQAYRLADIFVCVSENTRKDLERFASSEGLPPPEACVITHATEFRDLADIVEFRPHGSSHSYCLPTGSCFLFLPSRAAKIIDWLLTFGGSCWRLSRRDPGIGLCGSLWLAI